MQKQHDDAIMNLDLTVTGIIEHDGCGRLVTLPVPLLVQDGVLWLGHLADCYWSEAQHSGSVGFQAIAEAIAEAAVGLSLTSGHACADIRLSMRPLSVVADQYDAWRSALYNYAEPGSSENRVVFGLWADSMVVCPDLAWLCAYCVVPCEVRNHVLQPVQVVA